VWTNDDFIGIGEDIPFEQCVSEMALAGFEGCSVGHKFPTDARVLSAALELRGLSVTEPWASTFFTVQGMERRTLDGFEQQLAFIKDVGGETVVVAELGHAVHQQPVSLFANKPVFDDDQWRRLTQGLNRLGRRAAGAGMKLCYHHHMGTGVQTRAEVDRLMAGTDPALVNLLLDTAHLRWSGDDPLDMARVYAKRIKHVHCKDVRLAISTRARDEGWTFREIEAGYSPRRRRDIDFRPVRRRCPTRATAAGSWSAEQDAQGTPLTYAKRRAPTCGRSQAYEQAPRPRFAEQLVGRT
jgi:inosose dehydratase